MKRKILVFFVFVILIFSFCFNSIATALPSIPPSGFTINLCGIVHPDGGDRIGWQTRAEYWLSNIPNSRIYKKTAFTAIQLGSYLKTSNFFVVHTHGNPTALLAVDSNGTETQLNSSHIDGWTYCLGDLKLAFLAACSTGAGGISANNIVNSVFSKGARCVIGYATDVSTAANYIMIEEFCTAIGAGYKISAALTYADAQVLARYGSSGSTNLRHIRGSTDVALRDTIIILNSIEEPVINQPLLCNSCLNNESSELTYFINENGIYGYFDKSKIISVSAKDPATNISNVEKINEQCAAASDYFNMICNNSSRYALTDHYYTEDTGVTTYIYNHRVGSIDTNDYIFLMLNDRNELISYGKPYEGAFDDVKLDITELNNAEYLLDKKLTAQGLSAYDIVDERLIWDNGNLSIRYSVEYTISNDVDNFVTIDDFVIALH